MGGQIWVESQPGVGSTFHFTARFAGQKTEPVAPHEVRPEVIWRNRQRCHILLAEDNTVNQRLAARLLEKEGHTVFVVSNGYLAVAALETQRFDLILMDVQMPEMNGYEATAAIREKERATGAHIPIIAMTAHALKGDRERCIAAGMDGYLSKPIKASDLVEAIEASPPVRDIHRELILSASPVEDALDRQEALSQLDGDVGVLVEIATLFLEESPALLLEIRGAIARNDAEALELAAHSLKAGVAGFGARSSFAAAEKLETMGRDGRLEGALEAWEELTSQIERLTPALAALLRDNARCIA
jgi:CheY-like chemotaxis protein